MSTRCVNPNCATEVKDGWSFCSYCGTDNRPPRGLDKEASDYALRMRTAYALGRIGLIMIPAGIFFVIVMGRRWKLPWAK